MSVLTHGSDESIIPKTAKQAAVPEWISDRSERLAHVRTLIIETEKHPNQQAAEWRLRCKRQANINSKLKELGKLAQLMCGPALVTLTGLNDFVRLTRWRDTLDESPMMFHMNVVQRAQLIGAKSNNWTRIEKSFQSFGHMMCLCIKDLNQITLLESVEALKIWLYRNSFRTDESTDNSIEYLKWLGKSCQAVLLRVPVPKFEKFDPILDQEGNIAPFTGKLSFISDYMKSGLRRRTSLTMDKARILAQIGNLPRALAYPSHTQIVRDIRKTTQTFQSEWKVDKAVLAQYATGLSSIVNDYGYTSKSRVHVSLVNKGKYEISHAQGGGAKLLVMNTRKYTDRILTPELLEKLSQHYDQFGKELVSPATAVLAGIFLGFKENYNRKGYTVAATVGDILYVQADEIEELWRISLNSDRRVPSKLGHILTLTASKLIMECGSYNNEPIIIDNIMMFKTRINVFTIESLLKVKAGLSIEAGLKCRLTTSGYTAFAHISQLPANYMRDYLSKDPFCRVGFQEAEKLWEVLKIYRTKFDSNRKE